MFLIVIYYIISLIYFWTIKNVWKISKSAFGISFGQATNFWLVNFTFKHSFISRRLIWKSKQSGPAAFSGPIGTLLAENVWERPVKPFDVVDVDFEELPDSVIDQLSTDMKYFYKICDAVTKGIVYNFSIATLRWTMVCHSPLFFAIEFSLLLFSNLKITAKMAISYCSQILH